MYVLQIHERKLKSIALFNTFFNSFKMKILIKKKHSNYLKELKNIYISHPIYSWIFLLD